MKMTIYKMEYTINLGNYQNVKLGGEWEMNETDKIEDVARAAREELARAFKAIQAEKAQKKEMKQDDTEISADKAFDGMNKAFADFVAATAVKKNK